MRKMGGKWRENLWPLKRRRMMCVCVWDQRTNILHGVFFDWNFSAFGSNQHDWWVKWVNQTGECCQKKTLWSSSLSYLLTRWKFWKFRKKMKFFFCCWKSSSESRSVRFVCSVFFSWLMRSNHSTTKQKNGENILDIHFNETSVKRNFSLECHEKQQKKNSLTASIFFSLNH